MDYYQAAKILGVKLNGLTLRIINKAYRMAAKPAHPDNKGGGGTTKKMQRVNDAKDILIEYVEYDTENKSYKTPPYQKSVLDLYFEAMKRAGIYDPFMKHTLNFISLHVIFFRDNPAPINKVKLEAFKECQEYWNIVTDISGVLYREFCKQERATIRNAQVKVKYKEQREPILNGFMNTKAFDTINKINNSESFLTNLLRKLNDDPFTSVHGMVWTSGPPEGSFKIIEALISYLDTLQEQSLHARLRIGMFYIGCSGLENQLALNEAAIKAGVSSKVLADFMNCKFGPYYYENKTAYVREKLLHEPYCHMSKREAAEALGVSPSLIQKCRQQMNKAS